MNPDKYAQGHRLGQTLGIGVVCVVLFFVLGPLIEEWSKMPGTPELQIGQRIVYQMAGRENLRQVGFFESYPDARPSNFVAMVSDERHPLWPGEASAKPIHREVGPLSNRILRPDGLEFSSWERNRPGSDEIVLKARDDEQKLVVIGYVAGQAEPAFEYVWDFPTTAKEVPLR